MRAAVMLHLEESTIIVKAAAVADFMVMRRTRRLRKPPRAFPSNWTPRPISWPSWAARRATACWWASPPKPKTCCQEARRKLESKNCDMVVANLVGGRGRGFESDDNEVMLVLEHRRGNSGQARAQDRDCASHLRRNDQAAPGAPQFPMNRDQLRRNLEFYRDLGVTDVYRAEAPPAGAPKEISRESTQIDAKTNPLPQEPVKQPVVELPTLQPEGDTLAKIQEDIGPDCRRCRLCEQRSKIVFGSGDPNARLVFVGEGPGADEDAQGLPFVGRAGQLLTQMIEGTASKEGIPHPPPRRLYLQRGEVPASRKPHAPAG